MNQVKKATDIVKKLQAEGFKAYFAGGYVRDKLIGREPKDIDIVTSAKPDDIDNIFEKTIDVGKKFGVSIVIQDGSQFEVGTFRSESEYIDKRRPSSIEFTDEVNDARRRDFTVNAIFYDPVSQKYIDHVGGMEDCKKRIIRFIGNPKDRINEDHLRLIRAIRMKITLGFQYDQKTFDAVRGYSQLIEDVSKERVRDELNLIMHDRNRHVGLIELSESKLLKIIMPEVEDMKSVPQPYQFHKEGDVFTHTYLALKSLPDNSSIHLAWAVLFHDIGKVKTMMKENGRIIFHDHAQKSAEMARKILKRLKFSRSEQKVIIYLIENHMKVAQIDKMRPGKRLDFLTDYRVDDLVKLTIADQRGKEPTDLSFVKNLESQIQEARKAKQKMIEKESEKFFSGDDLIKLGINPGPIYKKILSQVKDKIVNGEIGNKKQAIKFVKDNYDIN